MTEELTPTRIVLWLATHVAARARIDLHRDDGTTSTHMLEPGTPACRLLSAGAELHCLLIDRPLASPLEPDRSTGYELALQALDPADETRGSAGASGRRISPTPGAQRRDSSSAAG